jgi:hypothetical protein
LVSSNSSCPFVLFLLVIVLSVLLRYTDSDYPFGIFKLFLSFVLFLLVIMLSVLLRYTDSDYPFGIFILSLYNK